MRGFKQKNVKLKLRSNHADATTEVLTKIRGKKPRRVKVCPIWSDYYTPPKTDNLTIPYNTPLEKEKTPYQKYQILGFPSQLPTCENLGWSHGHLGGTCVGGSAAQRRWVSKNRRHENTRTKQAIPFFSEIQVLFPCHIMDSTKYLHCWILWNCWPLVWGFWCIRFTMQGKNKHTENQG